MLREMAAWIEALTVETPLVLVLEDVHWSDDATLDLVAWLARHQEPGPVPALADIPARGGNDPWAPLTRCAAGLADAWALCGVAVGIPE